MADRYWVAGGTGNYNSTTNWSATSGGASGASVPSSADNIFFNGSSGVGTATINVASNCANLNLTGFAGTLAFTNNLSVSGTALNFGLGTYTITGINNLRLLTAMTITSNGTIYTGNVEFAGAVTYTLADNMSVSGEIIISGVSARTLNGNTLNILGNLTVSFSNSISGTTLIVLGGTGTWNHTGTGLIRNNLTINTSGTITLGATINYDTGTLTYTAGTVVTTSSTLNIAAATTFNTSGMSWNNIAITSGTQTLNSLFSANGTMTLSISTIFAGTAGFSVGTLNVSAANLTHQLVSTVTYTINTAFTCTAATDASRVLFRSTIAASKAILTLNSGATNNLRFVNATDINSSLGRTIYSYRGVFSNTNNWSLLSTDPVISTSASTFIN
jgi:hypothetical protein